MAYSVMPDLIRHPEGFEKTGFRLSPERRLSLNQAIYGQTLFRRAAACVILSEGCLAWSETLAGFQGHSGPGEL